MKKWRTLIILTSPITGIILVLNSNYIGIWDIEIGNGYYFHVGFVLILLLGILLHNIVFFFILFFIEHFTEFNPSKDTRNIIIGAAIGIFIGFGLGVLLSDRYEIKTITIKSNRKRTIKYDKFTGMSWSLENNIWIKIK